MKAKIALVARLLLGLIYFIFGLNGLFNFIPMTPPPMPDSAVTFMTGMMAAPYFFPVLKATEAIGGFLLLSGYASALGLILLAPITLQIFLFHGIMTPGAQNLILPLAMGVLHIVAATAFWSVYCPLFKKTPFKV